MPDSATRADIMALKGRVIRGFANLRFNEDTLLDICAALGLPEPDSVAKVAEHARGMDSEATPEFHRSTYRAIADRLDAIEQADG